MNAQLDRFLEAIGKLPPTPGIVWRGSSSAPSEPLTLQAPTASSFDIRVATENFATPYVLAIANKTGRSIGPLSAHPAEQEVVMLPGITLVKVLSFTHELSGISVSLFEELVDSPQFPEMLPANTADFVAVAQASLTESFEGSSVAITSLGKYTAPTL